MCMSSRRACASCISVKSSSSDSRSMLRCRRRATGPEVDLEADLPTLLTHIATRWKIEVLFGDGKEELGLDHYQLMSVGAIVRFWTLALLAYVFLEEEQARLQEQWQRPV